MFSFSLLKSVFLPTLSAFRRSRPYSFQDFRDSSIWFMQYIGWPRYDLRRSFHFFTQSSFAGSSPSFGIPTARDSGGVHLVDWFSERCFARLRGFDLVDWSEEACFDALGRLVRPAHERLKGLSWLIMA